MSATHSLHTLNLLLEKVSSERDEAQAWLAECQQRATQARSTAGELNQYRQDYEKRWGRQFSQSGTMDIVQCYQNFSGKLNDAIESQDQLADHAEQRLEAARAALVAVEMRVAAIKKLIERREAEAQLMRQRQEQKASDEFAARVARDQLRNHPRT
ncbi:flagellar export protein FliJ [Burkholderiaceae bacterium UC74_6]